MLFKITVAILALFCCNAYTEYHQGGGHNLQTVPELESYGKIQFPHYDIIDLGTHQKGDIPPKVVHITKKIVIRVPKPYPVEIPHPVPYPIHHKIPVPIVHTKILKVPEPVPFPVTNTVQVPVEVPKPYPVSAHEYQASTGDKAGYGGDAGGSGQHDFNQVNYDQFSNQGNYGQNQEIQHGFAGQDSFSQASPVYGVPGHEAGQPLEQYNQNQDNHQDFGGQDLYSKVSATYGVPGHVPGHPIGIDDQQNNNYQVNYRVSHDDGNGGFQGESDHAQSLDKSDYQVSQSYDERGDDDSPEHKGHQETEEH